MSPRGFLLSGERTSGPRWHPQKRRTLAERRGYTENPIAPYIEPHRSRLLLVRAGCGTLALCLSQVAERSSGQIPRATLDVYVLHAIIVEQQPSLITTFGPGCSGVRRPLG